MTAPTLTPKQRAAARAALTRSIKVRQSELERLQRLVPDNYLRGVIERLQGEVRELSDRRARMDPRKAPQLPELASRYLGGDRDPRRSPGDREAANRAMQRREAQEQAREQLSRIPRCIHGDAARLCPRCNQTPIEEVPF